MAQFGRLEFYFREYPSGAKLLAANPLVGATLRLGWPPMFDGRGWPQQCSFDQTSFARLLLLLRVKTLREKVSSASTSSHTEDLEDVSYVSVLATVRLEKQLEGRWPTDSRVVSSVDGLLQSFQQMRCTPTRGQYLGMQRPGKDACLTPSFKQNERLSTREWRVFAALGPAPYTGARAWFQWSVDGRLVAFPAHWYGPEIMRECLLVVNVDTQSVVVVISFSGECQFPGCSLAEWHCSEQARSGIMLSTECRAENAEYAFDHMQTAHFSPDCSLVAFTPQGDCRKIILVDCEQKRELNCSRQIPSVQHVPEHIALRTVPGGSVAFDPSSMQLGCASRLAFTMAENLCRSSSLRSSVAHSLCVYDIRLQRSLWQYEHNYCINEVCYSRYGDVLAATVCKRVGEHAPWDVVLFEPVDGATLHRLSLPGLRPFSHNIFCSPLATHLAVFSYRNSSLLNFTGRELLFVASLPYVPSLQQFCRLAVHSRVFSQSDVRALPVPSSVKVFLAQSLPCC